MHPLYRQTCRLCGSIHLKPVIDLGAQHLQGSFLKAGVLAPPARKLPTQLVRCDVTLDENGCGLLQLAHSFPAEILYANYWYRSGTNITMQKHLASIVDSALKLIGEEAPVVLDIGCNDGTLLSNYPARSTRYGVDPSDIARDIANGTHVINTVFPSEQAIAQLPQRGIDIITSIAVFYDLEDPVAFAKAVASLLSSKGVWIFEMSYAPLMLMQNSFDTICHEHIEYYTFAVLEEIVSRVGLRVFKVEVNAINGGSIRCYACHASNSHYGDTEDQTLIHRLQIHEFDMELDTDKPYFEFQRRIERIRKELNSLLFDIRAQGERVHVYGASTKGNVLLQWYGIDRLIVDCAADRNPQKVGARTLGSEIPVVSEEASRAAKPDYYLVLPWHFKHEFLIREQRMIESGTRMIFPLPEVSVVTRDNFDAALADAAQMESHMAQLVFG